MLKYAKIENEQTRTVSIGTGTNHAFYQSIGMTMMDVEQSDVDGQWYVAGYAPRKSEAQKRNEEAAARIAELQAYLSATDWYAVRYAETGVAIPEEVKAQRQAARVEIDELREVINELV